jgi:hypothetical protein
VNEGRRIGLRFENGNVLYYDIDPDGRVYWLKVHVHNGKLTRYRVREEKFAEWVRQQAAKHDAA